MKVNIFLDSANDMKFRIPIQLMGNAAYKEGHEVKVIQGQDYEDCYIC